MADPIPPPAFNVFGPQAPPPKLTRVQEWLRRQPPLEEVEVDYGEPADEPEDTEPCAGGVFAGHQTLRAPAEQTRLEASRPKVAWMSATRERLAEVGEQHREHHGPGQGAWAAASASYARGSADPAPTAPIMGASTLQGKARQVADELGTVRMGLAATDPSFELHRNTLVVQGRPVQVSACCARSMPKSEVHFMCCCVLVFPISILFLNSLLHLNGG